MKLCKFQVKVKISFIRGQGKVICLSGEVQVTVR